jgi:hypothetical protein
VHATLEEKVIGIKLSSVAALAKGWRERVSHSVNSALGFIDLKVPQQRGFRVPSERRIEGCTRMDPLRGLEVVLIRSMGGLFLGAVTGWGFGMTPRG